MFGPAIGHAQLLPGKKRSKVPIFDLFLRIRSAQFREPFRSTDNAEFLRNGIRRISRLHDVFSCRGQCARFAIIHEPPRRNVPHIRYGRFSRVCCEQLGQSFDLPRQFLRNACRGFSGQCVVRPRRRVDARHIPSDIHISGRKPKQSRIKVFHSGNIAHERLHVFLR